MQTLVVFILIGLAALYIAWRICRNVKNAKERKSACDCCDACCNMKKTRKSLDN